MLCHSGSAAGAEMSGCGKGNIRFILKIRCHIGSLPEIRYNQKNFG